MIFQEIDNNTSVEDGVRPRYGLCELEGVPVAFNSRWCRLCHPGVPMVFRVVTTCHHPEYGGNEIVSLFGHHKGNIGPRVLTILPDCCPDLKELSLD